MEFVGQVFLASFVIISSIQGFSSGFVILFLFFIFPPHLRVSRFTRTGTPFPISRIPWSIYYQWALLLPELQQVYLLPPQ